MPSTDLPPPPEPSPKLKPLPPEEKTDPHATVTNGVLKDALKKNEHWTIAGMVITGLVTLVGTIGGGLFVIRSLAAEAGELKAKEALDAANKVKNDQEALRGEVRRAQEQTDASVQMLRDEVRGFNAEQIETRADIQALYRFQKSGSPQPRLEKPLRRDGGGPP